MKKEDLFRHSLASDCCLQEALETLNITELQGMCFYMHLHEEISAERDMLMQHVKEALPKAVYRFAMCFDTERFQLFHTMLQQNGIISIDKLSIRKIMALRDMGLAYPAVVEDRRVLVVPKEIKEEFENLEPAIWEEMAAFNTKLLHRAQGALHFYGFVDTERLVKLCVQTGPEDPWDNVYLLEVLYDAILYHGIIEPEEEGFRHKRFWNYQLIQKKQAELKNIPAPKEYTRETLERVGKQNGIEWTLPMERLKQFLISEGGLSKNMAKREVESAWYEFNNGIPFDDVCHYLMDWYFSSAELETQEMLAFSLVQMFWTMPRWLFKGYSFEELGDSLLEEMGAASLS